MTPIVCRDGPVWRIAKSADEDSVLITLDGLDIIISDPNGDPGNLNITIPKIKLTQKEVEKIIIALINTNDENKENSIVGVFLEELGVPAKELEESGQERGVVIVKDPFKDVMVRVWE